jgi:hypothetical protein
VSAFGDLELIEREREAMLANFIRRFKENDRILRKDAVRLSRDAASQQTTNWAAAIFWAVVIILAILVYHFAGQK